MADVWDDSDDDWDKSDDEDELDKRLGLVKVSDSKTEAPAFDDEEEDLTLKEKEASEKANAVTLKAKGSALAKKKVSALFTVWSKCHVVRSSIIFILVPLPLDKHTEGRRRSRKRGIRISQKSHGPRSRNGSKHDTRRTKATHA